MALSVLTGTPAPTPTQSVIIGEQPIFQRKLNSKGKPTGSTILSGFMLRFGVPLSGAAAADFQIDTVSTKTVKKRKITTLYPVTNFKVSYLAASDAVEINFGTKESFPTGGQITVRSGLTTAFGGSLSGTAVFTISNGGKSVRPS